MQKLTNYHGSGYLPRCTGHLLSFLLLPRHGHVYVTVGVGAGGQSRGSGRGGSGVLVTRRWGQGHAVLGRPTTPPVASTTTTGSGSGGVGVRRAIGPVAGQDGARGAVEGTLRAGDAGVATVGRRLSL